MASQSSGWPCTTTNCALKALESHCLRQNCTTCLCSRQLHTHSRGFLLRAIFWSLVSLGPWTRVLIRPRNLAFTVSRKGLPDDIYDEQLVYPSKRPILWTNIARKKNILQRHSSFFWVERMAGGVARGSESSTALAPAMAGSTSEECKSITCSVWNS